MPPKKGRELSVELSAITAFPDLKRSAEIPQKHGGAERDRTADPLLAKQVLSQLSYSPIEIMVGLGRFELPTSPLSGVRSNQLSYRPTRNVRLRHETVNAPLECGSGYSN